MHQLAIWMNLCGWVEFWGKEMHFIANNTIIACTGISKQYPLLSSPTQMSKQHTIMCST